MREKLLPLFPDGAGFTPEGHLHLGGCDTTALAAQFGTPLYVFDEATLRRSARYYREAFQKLYPDALVLYASKSFIHPALARIFQEEGLGLDVVSGGELAVAQAAGFPMDKVYFHGNNKSEAELEQAVGAGVGRIVVDNFHELSLLSGVARKLGKVQSILLRVSPGIDAHTHRLTTTGIVDSKFGFLMITGQAEEAVRQALALRQLRLVGLHFHLGSPIYESEPYREAIEIVLPFAAQMRARHGLDLAEFSPGGGFAISYTEDRPAPMPALYADAIVSTVKTQADALGLPLPRLIVEPGRALVGRAGVALYTVGGSKDIPGVRRYVFLDGGMGDNIRPALYGAIYRALVANKREGEKRERVTLAGKFCESGDILIQDIDLPPLEPGDLVALPAAGAYCLAMASNYNASLKPAVVMVKEGQARLVRRRETYQDLMRCDLL